ncbi:hypothetical protein HDU96_003344 [Phlyctochytrium bullatum]|nr:hypothetical protein HDU96_003344 [Phlyctochytrium bullatum]
MVSTPLSKAEAAFKGLAVEYAEGENEDAAGFAKALNGVERLFILSNNYAHEVELAKAAVAANVKHIFKLSCIFASVGVEPGTIFYQHGKAEEAILSATAGKAAVTILRPHDFMENIFTRAGMIKSGAVYGNQGSAALSSISARDIAGAAAGVLTADVSAHAGMAYTLTGPEALTGEELCALTAEVIGKPVKFVAVDESAAIAALKAHLPERWAVLLAYLSVTYREKLPAGSRFATGWVKYLSGKEPQSWKEFLIENKANLV